MFKDIRTQAALHLQQARYSAGLRDALAQTRAKGEEQPYDDMWEMWDTNFRQGLFYVMTLLL